LEGKTAETFPDDAVVALLLEYIEHTSDLVGVVDAESRISYLNAAARKRLGVGDATDLTTADLFPQHAFAQYYDEVRPALLRSGVWTGEVPVLDATTGTVPMLLTVVARTGPGGEISGLVTHGRELSPERSDVVIVGADELTRLPQRAVLEDRMEVALGRARRFGSHVGVMLVDIDGLKDLNDTFGHATGDQIVRGLAFRLRQAVREVDTVARIGGDEFVVLFDGLADTDAALAFARRVHTATTRPPFDTYAGTLSITASFGLAMSNGTDHPNDLLRRADNAMYRAKASGGGDVVLFDEDAELTLTTLADDFAVAVSHGLIRPHVQSVVNLRTREVVGYQGFVRWEHPDRGIIAAESFINLVAETAMAPVVDLAVLRRTAAAAARSRRRGVAMQSYAHLSRRLLGDPGLEHYVAEVVQEFAMDPSALHLEIAHGTLGRGSRTVKNAVAALRGIGCTIVLTDLRGECDVNDIVEYQFDELRLSPQLVRGCATDPTQRRIVDATVALAHALDVGVIAVGVEDQGDEERMLDSGCDFAEGFLFGAVVPAGDAG
jgi:diguanylate cyclase (GGDEF)-like protein